MITDDRRGGDILSGYLRGMLFGTAIGMAVGTGMQTSNAYLGALGLVVLGVVWIAIGFFRRR